MTCTATYTVTQADLDAGSVTNTAIGHADGTPISTDRRRDRHRVQSAGAGLAKTATPATYDAVGDVISYSYVVTNTGNVTLTGPVTVADDKAHRRPARPPASLAPGASMTCTATYTITQADLDAGSVTNTAQAIGRRHGPRHTDDRRRSPARPEPGADAGKTATPGDLRRGRRRRSPTATW